MDWILYILIAIWAIDCALQLYALIIKHREDKANYRYVVCTQDGKSLIPIDTFDCESDARQHHLYQANKIIVRVTATDLRWYGKHISD